MKKRIITGLVMACVMIPVAFLTDTWVFPIFISALSLLAVYEILNCVGALKNYAVAIPSYILALAGPVYVRLPGASEKLYFAVAALYILLCAAVFMLHESRISDEDRNGREHLSAVTTSAFFVLYSVSGFSMLVMLCTGSRAGLYLLLSVFIISYMTDIFAYFTGMFFGKHKLIPKISPKKTIEGALGGTICSTLALTAFGLIITACDSSVNVKSVLILIPIGLIASVVSQIGDLLMSALKRCYGIKDFGWIFPGHGGILDRFDSVLAVSIITYVFNSIFKIFEDVNLPL